LSDVRGKIVVLDFWASWCGSSTRAVPRWSEVLADPKYADIIYLAVNQGESSSDVRKFVEQQSWPCQVAVDEQREIGRAFEVRSLPQTAILDRNGTIVDVLFGWGQNLEAVKSRLDRAMIRHDATVHETLDNIRARERTIKELVGRCAPAVVGLMVGRGGGSGVIVSADGMVLTAAHVTASAGIDVRVFLADGREVMGKSLGADHSRDAAIIKLEGAGPWPHVELGSAPHELGQWVFAMGHPGGYATDRAAPLRVGRIVKLPGGVGRARGFFATDCTVTHGDSGGPVFDLEGRVIGIHSFISTRLEENMHVPVEAYQSGWNRLVNSEVWGRSGRDGSVRAALGAFLRHVEGKGIVVTRVVPGSPAQRAGLLQGDLLLGFAGLEKVESLEDLEREMRKYRPGDRVKFMLRRGEEPIRGELTFAARLD
jgi:serine protease Do